MRSGFQCAFVVCLVCLVSARAFAQQPADSGAAASKPTPNATELPAVEVIQKQEKQPTKTAQKKSAPKKRKVAAPAPQPPAQPVVTTVPGTGGIDTGSVMMSPVQGSSIPIGKFPGAVGRASASDVQGTTNASVPEALQNTVPSAILSDAQGNVFQRDLQFRGFDASPVNGQAQGIAVYQNGVRINESFGDIVNWDFLPDNAIAGMTIIGANPVFGLNAIGGAAVITMRDGFNFQGAEFDIRGGSFGRIQSSLALGGNSGPWGVFVAVEGIKDGGFRDYSEAEIKRMYTDLGVRGDGKEFHLNFTGADNTVGVTAAAPEQLLDLGWNRTFTSPQTTDNQMHMLSLNGSVKATPTLTFSGVTYYRWFKQEHVDGNIADAGKCDDDAEFEGDDAGSIGPGDVANTPSGSKRRFLCWEDDDEENIVQNQDGLPFIVNSTGKGFQTGTINVGGKTVPLTQLGSIDRTSQDAETFGVALQGVEKTPLFGHPNQFLMGSSYDHGRVKYSASSELGFFGPNFVVNSFDDPVFLTAPDDVRPRLLTTKNDYVGVYFSDTFDVTSRFALTVGGRYNYARIDIQNDNPDLESEDKLTGTSEYYRFNPMAGATYALTPGLTLYGSYAEANRAPTAAELACADPVNPCLIESFLTADPPLKQVVSRTFELGLRGDLASWHGDQRLEWTAGLFRTENQDDIIAIASAENGRGYFTNGGDTLRQGIEAGIQYQDRRLSAYANYAFIDATFRTANVFSSPDNPAAENSICPQSPDLEDDAACINVSPGDRLPGVPRHRFKAGFDYWLTSKWKFGSDLVVASNQIFLGDEGNDNPPLDGYAKVDIRTSYNLTDHVQIYGLIDNLFDTRYGLFGNFFNRDAANNAATADPSIPDDYFTNARTITPAPPFAIYGGLKVKY
jgi:iron complex outermembrane recepter protein